MSNSVLSVSGVTKVFAEGDSELRVLDQIDFELGKAERLAIIGSSGSGKSTLLNILGGLDQPTTGTVSIAGVDLYAVPERKRCDLRNHKLGFVYQFHHLLPEFTALENIAMPLLIRGESVAEATRKSEQFLEAVGLTARREHKPAKLSGGERQRVAIARALVAQPACVLMDEPTGNLDRHTAADIQQLMTDLNQQFDTCFIVVTHDPELAKQMDRIVELRDGQLHPFTY